MSEFLRQLYVVASNPYAIAAYTVAVVAWLVLGSRIRRNNQILKNQKGLTEEQRLEVLRLDMNSVPPKGKTSEQWLKSRVRYYYLLASAISCLAIVVIIIIAKNTPYESNKLILTVIPGQTAKAFNEDLYIKLNQITHDDNSSIYKVSATAVSPGYPPANMENMEVGSISTYNGKNKYQIQILKADTSEVNLSVIRE